MDKTGINKNKIDWTQAGEKKEKSKSQKWSLNYKSPRDQRTKIKTESTAENQNNQENENELNGLESHKNAKQEPKKESPWKRGMKQ